MAHLTIEQRYTISVLKSENCSQKVIAEKIGKDPSVVSRELSRNCDLRSKSYKAELAQRKYQARKESKVQAVRFTDSIQTHVKLKEDYSPEQIVGISKLKGEPCVSHERIYQYVWEDKQKGGDLYVHLRNKGKRYRKRSSSKDKRGIIVGRVDIDQRPKIVEERKRFGDFEADTIVGKDHRGGLLTLNDRMTGIIKIGKLTAKEAQQVADKTQEILQDWKPFLYTITSDNGKEFANHKTISESLEIDFFFAKPHHPWERGSNENGNRLIRQYFPKGTDFTNITDDEVKIVEDKINNRPRKRLGFLSPIQFFNKINLTNKVAFTT